MMHLLAPIFIVMGVLIPMEANVSYYCPGECCCGIYASGYTASGTLATEGRTIAADKRFEFGQEIIIDGKTYVVEDRGGAIKNNKLDVFVESHAEALKLGRQHKTVFIKIGGDSQ